MNFLLSAGEASGDTYGAQLIESLRQLAPLSEKHEQQRPEQSKSGQSISEPEPTFFGMGGEKMRAAGCDIQIHAKEVAVVGLVEVVRHLPDIRRRFKHLVAEAARRKPDAAILIDFPDFNLRLARELHRLGIPVFYFVSPQIWAWRTGRVKQIQKYVRKMIVIFPFEQEFYRRHGVEVSYVGHPLAYVPQPEISREEFAAKQGLDPAKQWIALLPGSRRKEVRLNLPVMLQAAQLLQGEYEFVLPVASTLSQEWLREQIEQGLKPQINGTPNAALKGRSSTGGTSAIGDTSAAKAEMLMGSDRRPEGLLHPITEGGKESKDGPEDLLHPVDGSGKEQAPGLKPQIDSPSDTALKSRSSTNRVAGGNIAITLTDNARATMLHARASVVASGTATVEAALSGAPFVVVYRLSALTWILGRRLVKLDTFAMPNLIAGKKIVPELIQSGFTAETVFQQLKAIIPDSPARQQMLDALKMVQAQLHDSQAADPPTLRASREIMAVLQKQ